MRSLQHSAALVATVTALAAVAALSAGCAGGDRTSPLAQGTPSTITAKPTGWPSPTLPTGDDVPLSRPDHTNLEEGMVYSPDEVRRIFEGCGITFEQAYKIDLDTALMHRSDLVGWDCDLVHDALADYAAANDPSLSFLFSNPAGRDMLPTIEQPRLVGLTIQGETETYTLLFNFETMALAVDWDNTVKWWLPETDLAAEFSPMSQEQADAVVALLEDHLHGWDYYYDEVRLDNGQPTNWVNWSLTVVLDDYSLWRFDTDGDWGSAAPADLTEVVQGLFQIAQVAI
ncbi:MAG: hypothetical protein LBR27_07235 [Bifidobacteriaceae bacterium]|jgi:hypothetical protein|nr:hypothetical protein [Bifidobacteriaceae bacterium]